MTATQVKERLETNGVFADQLSKSAGVYTFRRGFFYRHGGSEDVYVEKIKSVFPNATIVDSGEHWAPFRGGASVARQSHWYVKFSL